MGGGRQTGGRRRRGITRRTARKPRVGGEKKKASARAGQGRRKKSGHMTQFSQEGHRKKNTKSRVTWNARKLAKGKVSNGLRESKMTQKR